MITVDYFLVCNYTDVIRLCQVEFWACSTAD